MPDTKYCQGCRDDFYNGKNSLGVKQCWSLKTAKVVTRYKLGWWTPPTSRAAFTEVKVHHCNHAPGQYEFYEKIPIHVK